MAVILTDLETFAEVLSAMFPKQHDAHVNLYRVVMRNRAAADFWAEFKAYADQHGTVAATMHFANRS